MVMLKPKPVLPSSLRLNWLVGMLHNMLSFCSRQLLTCGLVVAIDVKRWVCALCTLPQEQTDLSLTADLYQRKRLLVTLSVDSVVVAWALALLVHC